MRTQEQSIRAERKTERSTPKSQISGTERESEKNERSAEREVSERERSGERAESAAHAAKVRVKPVVLCTICTLHFSEAKRGPGPGTSRLDFSGNPMAFL